MRNTGSSIRSIFYRLLLSYSLVGTLPLAVACLVLLVWGNTLVVRYVQNLGNGFTERVAEEVDETVLRFQEIRGYLSVVEVHLSSSDGMRKYSSTEYPRRPSDCILYCASPSRRAALSGCESRSS